MAGTSGAASIATVCGNCKHWHRVETQQPIVGDPKRGECRAAPPQVIAIPMQGPQGQVGMQVVATYPPLPENFHPCDGYRLRLSQDWSTANRG